MRYRIALRQSDEGFSVSTISMPFVLLRNLDWSRRG
jgi:hypothetical protein